MEDPYEDIFEDDDEIEYEDVYESSGDEDDDDNGEYPETMKMTTDAAEISSSKNTSEPSNDDHTPKIKSWNPFLSSNTSSTPLEMDETAYKMHHATPEWPSLSLDILPDRHLGDNRTRFPHTVTMVVGSQADKKGLNKLTVLRMSDLCRIPGSGREKTEKELDDEMLGEEWKHEDDEDDDEDSSSEEEEEEELDPVLEHYSFPHPSGGINRASDVGATAAPSVSTTSAERWTSWTDLPPVPTVARRTKAIPPTPRWSERRPREK